jgi:hypothetical protein
LFRLFADAANMFDETEKRVGFGIRLPPVAFAVA